jgi:hypothetical protein
MTYIKKILAHEATIPIAETVKGPIPFPIVFICKAFFALMSIPKTPPINKQVPRNPVSEISRNNKLAAS